MPQLPGAGVDPSATNPVILPGAGSLPVAPAVPQFWQDKARILAAAASILEQNPTAAEPVIRWLNSELRDLPQLP